MKQRIESDINPVSCPEKTAYHRKKQPEQVRNALLESAAALAASRGLNGITVQAVAQAAGVTKGGFFHHFPHKQALLDAVFDASMADSDRKIDRLMAEDTRRMGCFTRAYVTVAFDEILQGEDSLRMPLTLSMMSSPDLCQRWAAWMNDRLERHRLTDSLPLHQTVRLAADGAWLAQSLVNGETVRDMLALRDYLLTLIRGNEES